MNIPKYIKLTDYDEDQNLVKSLKITTPDGVYVMDRSRIKGLHFTSYRAALLKGEIEKGVQNMIAALTTTETGEPVGISDILSKDPRVYQALNKGMQLILGEEEDFL